LFLAFIKSWFQIGKFNLRTCYRLANIFLRFGHTYLFSFLLSLFSSSATTNLWDQFT
jgi:hypothetical protein